MICMITEVLNVSLSATDLPVHKRGMRILAMLEHSPGPSSRRRNCMMMHLAVADYWLIHETRLVQLGCTAGCHSLAGGLQGCMRMMRRRLRDSSNAKSVDGTWREKNVVMWQSRSVVERRVYAARLDGKRWRFPKGTVERYDCGGDDDTKRNKIFQPSGCL